MENREGQCYSPCHMLRGLILLLLGVALTFITLPFVMTSRALDEHGITIAGRVQHKSETVRVDYSGWERSRDATIEYPVPETGSVSFFTVHPDERHYDALQTRQVVQVRYLPRRDVPKLPMADVLWQMHALPTVRLMDFPETSKFRAFFATPRGVLAGEFLGALAGLFILWRLTRWRPFGWAAGIGVVAGMGFLLVQDFPRPTPSPSTDVRRASGHVTSIG